MQELGYWERVAAHNAAFFNGLRPVPEADFIDDPPPDCDSCSGTGATSCPYCHGDGEVECECSKCSHEHYRTCLPCDGHGTVSKCDACKGSGKSTGLTPLFLPHPADEWTVPSLLSISSNGSFT